MALERLYHWSIRPSRSFVSSFPMDALLHSRDVFASNLLHLIWIFVISFWLMNWSDGLSWWYVHRCCWKRFGKQFRSCREKDASLFDFAFEVDLWPNSLQLDLAIEEDMIYKSVGRDPWLKMRVLIIQWMKKSSTSMFYLLKIEGTKSNLFVAKEDLEMDVNTCQ